MVVAAGGGWLDRGGALYPLQWRKIMLEQTFDGLPLNAYPTYLESVKGG